MGQGGHVTIINNTGSKMIRDYIGSYQMEAWRFPETIASGQSEVFYVEWCDGVFKCTSDDRGSAYYHLENEPGKRVEFTMWNANQRNFTVKQFGFKGISSDEKRIDWKHNGEMVIEISDIDTKLDLKKWMGRIDGNTPLNKMNIPGTHDSLTYNLPDCVIPASVQTQNLNIPDQLNIGCRYLDIRINSNLEGRHGFIDCKDGLQNVMNWVRAFLNENKDETIVMRLKHDEGGGDAEFNRKMDALFNEYKDYFWKNDLSGGWPLLKDVRGKVVVLDQLDGRYFCSKGYGVNYSEDGRQKLLIQDDYDRPNEDHKLYEIKQNIETAYDPEKMKLNHVSAVGFAAGFMGLGWTPRDYADYLNVRMVEYLTDVCLKRDFVTGLLAFDFIDQNITKVVIFNNDIII